MKKLVLFFVVLLFTAYGFSDVAIRVQLTGFTSNPHGTDVLTVSIEANATYAYPIDKFQGSIDMGANLAALLTGSSFTAAGSHYFSNTKYTQNYGISGSSIYFHYQYSSGGRTSMPVDSWQKIFDVTLNYTWDPTKQTTFYWKTDPYYYSVEVMAHIDIGGGSAVDVPIPVTGGQIDIPSNLVDRTLPVQMSSFAGKFDYEKGITLVWKTQSETNCAGFHVLRSESENGRFSAITTKMIQAQGNSSDEHEYAFTDKNVTLARKYHYKIQEISTFANESHEIYYGAIDVATPTAPDQFALKQNYPNPFNPDTKIVYSLPEKANVVLKVYNLLGKEIRTLINEEKQPGIYEAKWDGKDEFSRTLSSGLYFYKITAGDKVEIRKMMKVQ